MDTLTRARDAIRRAEDDLRGLLSEAARIGEYDSLVTLADWAKQLGALTMPQHETTPTANGRLAEPPSALSVPKPRGKAGPTPAAKTAKAGRRDRKKKLRTRGAGADYPKFLRRGEELVKIGWSKREKATYEHKAPKDVLAILAAALTKAGDSGRQFTMDSILPLSRGAEGEVPSYQTYLALAWFRAENLVTQHGRQGYSLPAAVNIQTEVQTKWEQLPTR
jgi:hypothetical protein